MKLIVGLGNPGQKYEKTRHNAGFMLIDSMVDHYQLTLTEDKYFQAAIATTFINGEKVFLAKPLTYMNESGRAVRRIADYYDIDDEDIVIVYDDMDLKPGHLRLRQTGSAGGHNGIKSIIQHLGTKSFKRLRLGINRPQNQSIVDYVLGDFSKEDRQLLADAITKGEAAIDLLLETNDFNQVMNQFNRKEG